MSSITTITNELRSAELTMKDEGKLLRMICVKANQDRRVARTGSNRLTLAPRVLRRSDSAPVSQA